MGNIFSSTLPKVRVLSYDPITTGSPELRMHNHHRYINGIYGDEETKGGCTTALTFAKSYDKVKNKEPFFDGYMMGLILSRNENILYGRINIEDQCPTDDPTVNFFRSSRFGEVSEPVGRFDDYENGLHIIIMCPFSEEMLKKLKTQINNYINNPEGKTLYIHIQGETFFDLNGEDRYAPSTIFSDKWIDQEGKNILTGFKTTGGGLFGDAFNLYSGAHQAYEFRKYLKYIGAEFYSVVPDCREPDGSITLVNDIPIFINLYTTI